MAFLKEQQQINLLLDAEDYAAVNEAVARRESFPSGIPAGSSGPMGAVIAEICRGWMEMLDTGAPAQDGADRKDGFEIDHGGEG